MRKSILLPNCEKKKRFEFLCRGCSMFGREQLWRNYSSSISTPFNRNINSSYLTFEEEPDNRHDPNAVKIVCCGEFFGMLGYVAKESNQQVKHILRICDAYRIETVDMNEIGNREIRLVVYYT